MNETKIRTAEDLLNWLESVLTEDVEGQYVATFRVLYPAEPDVLCLTTSQGVRFRLRAEKL